MVRSLIGTEVAPPTWLAHRSGMPRYTRRALPGYEVPLHLLVSGGLRTITNARHTVNCGCWVPEGDAGHFDHGTLLNPTEEFLREEGREVPGRVALLYENLMYVGNLERIIDADGFPRAVVGRAVSMWWTPSSLAPGWYDNEGRQVEYQFNPRYLGDETEVMALSVANGSRLLGQMLRRTPGRTTYNPVNQNLTTDIGNQPMQNWMVETFIAPRPEHRSSVPESPRAVTPDPLEGLDTHEARIAEMERRFSALTLAASVRAREEDWCGDYEEACRTMGLSEDHYSRERTEDGEAIRNVTFEVTMELTYNIGTTALDRLLENEFTGSHDVRDSVDVKSRVTVNITQGITGDQDFDEDQHDLDEILDNAGYNDYDDADVLSWRTI